MKPAVAVSNPGNVIFEIVDKNGPALLGEWIKAQLAINFKQGSIKENDLREQCKEFLQYFTSAARSGNITNIKTPEWEPALTLLSEISAKRGEQGFSPSETATFVFSFKKPYFDKLFEKFDGSEGDGLGDQELTISAWL